MTQTPTLFKCTTHDGDTIILAVSEIIYMVPAQDYEHNSYIKVNYECTESCLNETIYVSKVEVYNIE
jgi:hypothetical protein